MVGVGRHGRDCGDDDAAAAGPAVVVGQGERRVRCDGDGDGALDLKAKNGR